ncbi:heterokaryon incompatibility protein-domain-containing protein [Stachybotrys elegans]|uniref:Heterokaryon incompatibility protein-domain-containing protein n=1 Tax=Stachybotrys elegans TaxID=80388 RepID=A0A8K0WMZ4_9HYPO|nr:heterokaryon incompatibility protein-domain-containing protein [Stachybotrys elegans]
MSFQVSDQSGSSICALCKQDKRSIAITSIATIEVYMVQVTAAAGCIFCALIEDALASYDHGSLLANHRNEIFIGCGSPSRPGLYITKHPWVDIDRRNNAWSFPDFCLEIFSVENQAEPVWECPWADEVGVASIRRNRLHSCDTSSDAALQTTISWIEECTTRHEKCNNAAPPFSPQRILMIEEPHVRLIQNPPVAIRYACLSHCWGDGPTLQLTNATLETLLHGVRMDEMPKTFREACEMCTKLGITYLWIDSLCINQDDLSDWTTVSGTIESIYANAYLTLAATASSDSNRGLHRRMPSQMASFPLSSHPGLFIRRRLPDFPSESTESDEISHPLLHRGWVLQERTLSARVLHFTGHMLVWECETITMSEDGSVNFNHSNPNHAHHGNSYTPFRRSGRLEDSAKTWRDQVEHYSKLDLTYERDRLPAISALAKHMLTRRSVERPGEGDEYYAGLFKSSFLGDLAWVPRSMDDQLALCDTNTPPTPSWSWASLRFEGVRRCDATFICDWRKDGRGGEHSSPGSPSSDQDPEEWSHREPFELLKDSREDSSSYYMMQVVADTMKQSITSPMSTLTITAKPASWLNPSVAA